MKHTPYPAMRGSICSRLSNLCYYVWGRSTKPKKWSHHSKDESRTLRPFERTLVIIHYLATIAASLQDLSWFLGLLSLTWASIVLMGALATLLYPQDFYVVIIVVLLESLRFVLALYATKTFTRTFECLTFSKYTYDYLRKAILIFLRILAPALHLILLNSPIYVICNNALAILRSSKPYEDAISKHGLPFNSIYASLFIFYELVMFNAALATFTLLYNLAVSFGLLFSSDLEDESFQSYYDEVVWLGTNHGLLIIVKKLPILQFAFQAMARDYYRGIYPLPVLQKYRTFIKYAFHNPKGVEQAYLSLDSQDIFEQQAAANIVGLWAVLAKQDQIFNNGDHHHHIPCTNLPLKSIRIDSSTSTKKLLSRIPAQLLTKLADKISLGQTGWAAANSFKALAEIDPKFVANTVNSRGKNIVKILFDATNPHNSLSISPLRALIPLLQEVSIKGNDYKAGSDRSVEERLREIMMSENFWLSERLNAAEALRLCGFLTEIDRKYLDNLEPGSDEYLFESQNGQDLLHDVGHRSYTYWAFLLGGLIWIGTLLLIFLWILPHGHCIDDFISKLGNLVTKVASQVDF